MNRKIFKTLVKKISLISILFLITGVHLNNVYAQSVYYNGFDSQPNYLQVEKTLETIYDWHFDFIEEHSEVWGLEQFYNFARLNNLAIPRNVLVKVYPNMTIGASVGYYLRLTQDPSDLIEGASDLFMDAANIHEFFHLTFQQRVMALYPESPLAHYQTLKKDFWDIYLAIESGAGSNDPQLFDLLTKATNDLRPLTEVFLHSQFYDEFFADLAAAYALESPDIFTGPSELRSFSRTTWEFDESALEYTLLSPARKPVYELIKDLHMGDIYDLFVDATIQALEDIERGDLPAPSADANVQRILSKDLIDRISSLIEKS